ncbi:hypothetical protein E8E13_008147 [Curvularia kusanoi]|uniref:ABC transporter n=1 Tax=Curvularia kusanoi TaxID=90978 RepID=A0A9P4W8Y9_CURKU|nr:hypothetical protein E8E13_008147 [Curvularia kusanoi]
MAATKCLNDDDFGPVVQGCRDDFDFTVKFELIIFSLVPSSIFVLVSLLRCLQLYKRRKFVDARLFLAAKLITLVAFAALQFSRFVFLAASPNGIGNEVLLAASGFCFAASALTIPLSYLEHGRARRPSMVLSIYLFFTLLLDAAHARTLWLSMSSYAMRTNTKLFTASVAFKLAILLLESKRKTAWLHWDSEKHSPEESSGFFDLGMFTWLTNLFMAGYSSVLKMDNLYHLDQNLSSEKLHDRFNACLSKSVSSGSKSSMVKALGMALMGPVLIPIPPRLVLIGFTFSQPFFLASVLSTIAKKNDKDSRADGFGLIGAAAIIYAGIALSRAFYGYYAQRAVSMVRGCLVSAVYTKTTELQSLAGNDAAVLTLMSTDIERVTAGVEKMHDVWADLVQAGLGCWLLQRKLGTAFLAPVIIVLCCGATMVWFGRASAKTQSLWMDKIQSRVSMTSKVITHVKQVKISGIAQTIEELVQALRVEELRIGNKYRTVLVLTSTISFGPQALSAVLAFALAGRELDVSSMFESLAYLVLLTAPLSGFFQRIPSLVSAITCFLRIQDYLQSEPRRDFRIISGDRSLRDLPSSSPSLSRVQTTPEFELQRIHGRKPFTTEEIAISIENASFAWVDGQSVLEDLSISLPFGHIVFVTGPVASGKSSLCKAVLGEIPKLTGDVKVHPRLSSIAFCDQLPFLVSGTLRQNIVRHLAFDQARFDEVVWATALAGDITSLSDGADTNIGTNGTTLSGGQKARVSLARALYDRSPLVVLDDVFSGLDNTTAARVFDRTFGPAGLLRRRGTTALVCTHSTRHISLADHIIVLGSRGTVIEQGSYKTLNRLRNNTTDLDFEAEKLQADAIRDLPQPLEVSHRKTDDAITKALDDRSRQLGDWKVYKHYINSMNKVHLLVVLVACILIATGIQLPTVWVGLWAADSLDKSNSFYLGIYGALNSLVMIGVLVGAWTCFVLMTIEVGRELHRRALWTVMHAPLRLFTTTDTGTITNLFSQDTTIIDSELSVWLLNFMYNVAAIIGSGIVIALASPYLAISYPMLIAIGYCVQMFYLRTSRQLRLLDLEAKSPLYTHFIDTVKGLATIRAFGWTSEEVTQNRELLDTSQRPAYLLAMMQQCLMFVLNLLVAFLAVGLVSLATQLKSDAAFTGASLISLMSFSETATALIFTYTALETSIGAVSRLKTFSDKVQSEHQPGEELEPPTQWPHSGSMVLRNVSASHGAITTPDIEEAVLALNNISLTIGAGEKIAVCGRTGSGKSTLILFLLRLLDPAPLPGLTFTIDGVDMLTVNRTCLRSRIIAVPQECVFLPDGSSIRSNIDPTGTVSDNECAAILDMVQLSTFVGMQGGLDAPMSAFN